MQGATHTWAPWEGGLVRQAGTPLKTTEYIFKRLLACWASEHIFLAYLIELVLNMKWICLVMSIIFSVLVITAPQSSAVFNTVFKLSDAVIYSIFYTLNSLKEYSFSLHVIYLFSPTWLHIFLSLFLLLYQLSAFLSLFIFHFSFSLPFLHLSLVPICCYFNLNFHSFSWFFLPFPLTLFLFFLLSCFLFFFLCLLSFLP